MNDSDIVEILMADYTNIIDYSFNGRSRKRGLRCGFCTRSYQYQLTLNQHVNSFHMPHLNQLSEQVHMQFILNFLYDTQEILYPEYHLRFFVPEQFFIDFDYKIFFRKCFFGTTCF